MEIEEYIEWAVDKYGLSNGINKEPSYGFGINDAPYITQSIKRGWHCPHFRAWQGVMQRGLSPKLKERFHTYREASVNNDWKYFTDYLSWSLDNYVAGWELDKDLLVKGNKEYGPNTCCFVPKYLNNVIKPKSSKTGLPFGVCYEGDRKGTYIIPGIKMKSKGGFKNAIDAHRAWQLVKVEQVSTALNRYAQEPYGFRTDLADSLNTRIWNLLLENSLGKETKEI